MGLGDIASGIGSLFGGGSKKSSSKQQSQTPLAATADQVAAVERNFNSSMQNALQSFSMQQLQTQAIVASEESGKQLIIFAALGGAILLLFLVRK